MHQRLFTFITGIFVVFSFITLSSIVGETVYGAWGIFGGDDTTIHICNDGSCTLE